MAVRATPPQPRPVRARWQAAHVLRGLSVALLSGSSKGLVGLKVSLLRRPRPRVIGKDASEGKQGRLALLFGRPGLGRPVFPRALPALLGTRYPREHQHPAQEQPRCRGVGGVQQRTGQTPAWSGSGCEKGLRTVKASRDGRGACHAAGPACCHSRLLRQTPAARR